LSQYVYIYIYIYVCLRMINTQYHALSNISAKKDTGMCQRGHATFWKDKYFSE